jgi:hypothetical protein
MSEDLVNNNEGEMLFKFKPSTRVFLQLGDKLIKNKRKDLIELVKNS